MYEHEMRHKNFQTFQKVLSTVELLPKVLLWTTCFPNSVSAAASASAASAVCIYYVIIGGALRAPLYVHDKIHTAAAEAAAPAAAPAADPWIHGSIFDLF